jgi:hypothetical protein
VVLGAASTTVRGRRPDGAVGVESLHAAARHASHPAWPAAATRASQLRRECGGPAGIPAADSLLVGSSKYIDFNRVASSFQLGTTPGVDVGLESPSYSSSAGSTNCFWMQYRDWVCCTWHYWSNGGQHVDPPAVWSWITNFTQGSNRT